MKARGHAPPALLILSLGILSYLSYQVAPRGSFRGRCQHHHRTQGEGEHRIGFVLRQAIWLLGLAAPESGGAVRRLRRELSVNKTRSIIHARIKKLPTSARCCDTE